MGRGAAGRVRTEGDRAGKSGRDEWTRLGSAEFRRGPGAVDRGGGGERREARGAGRWANQGAAASGCRAPAPRAPVLTEDKGFFFFFLFPELGVIWGSCECEVVTALC